MVQILNSTLHFAARNIIGYEGHEEIIAMVKLLLNAGGDIAAKTFTVRLLYIWPVVRRLSSRYSKQGPIRGCKIKKE